MRHHPMPATTHTVEMRQVADLNERLRTDTAITAGRLGPRQANSRSGGQLSRLPETAELIQVAWDGPPDFPNLYGLFSIASRPGHVIVDLHTPTLRQLCHVLRIQQVWGIGPD